MDASLLTSAVIVVLVASCSYWVLLDARLRMERHRPVVVTVGGQTIERPESWAILCLIGSVLILPLYLVARNASS